jgi:hypothetical protein
MRRAVKTFQESFDIDGLVNYEFAPSGQSQDNSPSHTSLVVQQFHITQPPYSPVLAPGDFWLFTTLKVGLKGALS